MKKQTKQLVALAVILVAVIAVYVGLRTWNNTREEKESAVDEPQTLAGLVDLTQLSYATEDGTRLTFHKKGENWVSSDEPDLPLVQESISEMEELFCGLSYERALEEHDELTVYGLSPAVRTVIGTDANGNTCTILLGNEIDYEDIFYAMVDGRDVVYTVSGELYNAISIGLMDLAEVETLTEFSEETVKSISLVTAEGGLVLNKLTEKKQQIQEQDTGEVDENGEAIMEEVVVTEEIYHWFLADGTEIPDGNGTLVGVLDELSALNFSGVYAFRPTDEELAVIGLDDTATKLTVEGVDGTVLKLILGIPDESGDSCYARLDGSDRIHLLPVSDVDGLLAMTAEALAEEPTAEE